MVEKKVFFVGTRGFTLYSSRMKLMEKLSNKNYKVFALGNKDKYSQKIIDRGIEFIDIPFYQGIFNPYYDLKSIKILNRTYKKIKPDYVHHFNAKPVLYGSLVAQNNKIDNVFNTITGLGSAFVNNYFIRKIASVGYKNIVSKSDKIVFQNHDDLNLFLDNNWIEHKQAKLIVSSGVNINKYKPVDNKSKKNNLKILMVSRLLWQKGVKEYIEAAKICNKKASNLDFLLGGEIVDNHSDGISKSWLLNNIGDDVKFLGYVNNMAEILREVDLFILPSAYREGVPRVLLEAAATGIPIITTDSPGCREVVDNGVNGILVPPKDHIKLAESIMNLISDSTKLKNMGEKSRKIAEKKFDIKKITEQYLELYE